MAQYNKRKLEVLGLAQNLVLKSRDLKDLLDVTIHNASTLLKHYYKQGLFSRWREGRTYCYEITKRGVKRYWYLIGKARCRIMKPVLDWGNLYVERCQVKDLGRGEEPESVFWRQIQRCYIGQKLPEPIRPRDYQD